MTLHFKTKVTTGYSNNVAHSSIVLNNPRWSLQFYFVINFCDAWDLI